MAVDGFELAQDGPAAAPRSSPGTTDGVPWAVTSIGYTDGTFDIKPAAIARLLGGTER